jgi:hypothetical protein
MNTIDDIALVRPGSVLVVGDGRRYRVNSIRKESSMRGINDEIEDLEKKLDSLQGLLDRVTKAGDADGAADGGDDSGGDDTGGDHTGGDDTDAAEVANLSTEVAALDKTLREAIAQKDSDFDRITKAIKERDNCSGLAALARARKEAPASFQVWQHGLAKSTTGAPGPAPSREAETAFDAAVGRIAARDKISRLAAMSKARAENADLFKALQDG